MLNIRSGRGRRPDRDRRSVLLMEQSERRDGLDEGSTGKKTLGGNYLVKNVLRLKSKTKIP